MWVHTLMKSITTFGPGWHADHVEFEFVEIILSCIHHTCLTYEACYRAPTEWLMDPSKLFATSAAKTKPVQQISGSLSTQTDLHTDKS
jgi:hypothetical protein